MTETKYRPLVTFALFAYNQEKYIREAVEGALSQTYEPLEIILSDDCSSDSTFEIMQEMAATYEGPDNVRVRQNEVNLGTIDHVITVAREAIGELLVVAAGDDVSMPSRTTHICEIWRENRPAAIISNHDRINENGTPIEKNVRYEPLERFQRFMETCRGAIRYDGKVRNIPGYCAAYNTKFVSNTPLAEERLFNEDSLFSYLINFEGKEIEYIDRSLLKVREAKTSVSARRLSNASIAEISDRERKLKQGCYSKMRFYTFLFRVCEDRKYESFDSVRKKLHEDLIANEFVVKYYAMPKINRFLSAFLAKRRSQRRFAAIRLFGVYSFWTLHKIQNIVKRVKS